MTVNYFSGNVLRHLVGNQIKYLRNDEVTTLLNIVGEYDTKVKELNDDDFISISNELENMGARKAFVLVAEIMKEAKKSDILIGITEVPGYEESMSLVPSSKPADNKIMETRSWISYWDMDQVIVAYRDLYSSEDYIAAAYFDSSKEAARFLVKKVEEHWNYLKPKETE